MTQPAPRRLLLVASDATPRGTAAPIRRYRLGRVLMGPQELMGIGDAPDWSRSAARGRSRADDRRPHD